MEWKPILLFMPWRWSHLTWVMLLPFAVAAYFFSAAPAYRLAIRSRSQAARTFVYRVYAPVVRLAERSTFLAEVIMCEDDALDGIMGDDWLDISVRLRMRPYTKEQWDADQLNDASCFHLE